ncbi:MAG: hypothetical protein KAT46_02895 [Deltaproteobacteria bacterium]|nr:hypothetical protein [Deltaproteobacteria bacterium]
MVFGLFEKKEYSRAEIMEAAGKFRSKGKHKKAIAEYQKILKQDSGDFDVAGRIAPLMAETKQPEDSWKHFKIAIAGYMKKGFYDKALSMVNMATRYLPREVEAWEAFARLEIEVKKRPEDAVQTLHTGHLNFRKKELLPKAIRLLQNAWKVEPWNFNVSFDLAKILLREAKKVDAKKIFKGLEEREKGGKLRKVRWALFWMEPGAGGFFRWMKAATLGR